MSTTNDAAPRRPPAPACQAHFAECSVSLALYGTELDPHAVSTRLGREPTLARRRGDRRSPHAAPAAFGCWLFTVDSSPPTTPGEVACELLDHFSADPQFWAALRRDFSVQIRFGFQASTLTGCFELEPEVADRLAATGATLAFHFYASGGD